MQLRIRFINTIERIVDKIHGKIGDVVTTIFYLIIGVWTIYSITNIPKIIRDPIIQNANSTIHGLMVLIALTTFFISLLGKYYKEPFRRLTQYILIVFSMTVFSFNYLSETFNSIFINILGNIKNIDVIPPELLIGNIRVITILLPVSITLPIFFLSLSALKNEKSKNKLREYEIHALLPTIHKFKDSTIDIEICKDLKTGLPCIVPEKVLNEHVWIQGGTGSGKSSLILTPVIEQLLDKKAYLQNRLKMIAFKCLEENIARIKIPITNMWFNENFDMEFIEPVSGKEKEFYKAFEEYSIGTIEKEYIVYEKKITTDIEFELDSLKKPDFIYEVNIISFRNNMETNKHNFILKKNEENYTFEDDCISIETNVTNNNETVKILHDGKTIDENLNIEGNKIKVQYNQEENNEKIKIFISTKKESLKHIVKVSAKGNGRLVPRNLGMTVVAPDGDLIKTTKSIADEYGMKVHIIDPIMDEIKKGHIAKFNPLIGDSPEKIGDIVASILVSMDVGSQSKVNPYFTNAGVRAVRNIVILLKVSYPHLFNREPTLDDVLAHLNNFDLVDEPIKYVEKNPRLMRRWQSVIDYVKTSFQSPPLDHDGKPVQGTSIGSQRKKTMEAIGGIINQLDNLLSREEVRYILCNEEESINLANILRKGENIAISTRQGHLGPRLGRAFALFFILSLQNEVLSRYGENENPEVPHFIMIDEFPMYCNESTETFFSFSRKYKCSTIIAIQNMGQLKKVSDEFGETIFTNTTTKILLPGTNLQDRKYWSEFFGSTKEMELMTGITTSTMFAENPTYSEQMRGTISEERIVSEEDVKDLNFHQLYYSYINKKGRRSVGKGTADFYKLDKKVYKNNYDFELFSMSEEEYNRIKEKEQRDKEQNDTKKEIEKINEQNIHNDFISETNIVTEVNEKETKEKEETNLDNDKEVFILMEEISIDMLENMNLELTETVNDDRENKETVKSTTNESEEDNPNDELIKILLSEDNEEWS
ncbi:MAG: TraM recognition domain-containing protein [Bacilli bacterium]|nr:TraM recognition domain-containing protein [Bacilli bacterium]